MTPVHKLELQAAMVHEEAEAASRVEERDGRCFMSQDEPSCRVLNPLQAYEQQLASMVSVRDALQAVHRITRVCGAQLPVVGPAPGCPERTGRRLRRAFRFASGSVPDRAAGAHCRRAGRARGAGGWLQERGRPEWDFHTDWHRLLESANLLPGKRTRPLLHFLSKEAHKTCKTPTTAVVRRSCSRRGRTYKARILSSQAAQK